MKRYFDKNITRLTKCEIFVFGSNLQGEHTGGAALQAYREFGAEWGVGVGPTGRCYAIPTMHLGISEIKPYVDDFIAYVYAHPNNRFIITRIGCGNAGFTDDEIAPLFKEIRHLPNVVLHLKWKLMAVFGGCPPKRKVIPIPAAITETDLKRLCEEYKYIIGSGIIEPLPDIRIRYVLGRDEFGFVRFGNFFMCEDGKLYVWSRNKDFEKYHNQAMVEEIFGDECLDRPGYFREAIFAGVETPFTDCRKRRLYTGDVVRVWLKGFDGSVPQKFYKRDSMLLAYGTLGENEDCWNAMYACALDNHCVTFDMCAKIQRCGTVFYRLDWGEEPVKLARRCFEFQDLYETSGLTEKDKEVLARYTPNFDKELWKYYGLKTLGVEFIFK